MKLKFRTDFQRGIWSSSHLRRIPAVTMFSLAVFFGSIPVSHAQQRGLTIGEYKVNKELTAFLKRHSFPEEFDQQVFGAAMHSKSEDWDATKSSCFKPELVNQFVWALDQPARLNEIGRYSGGGVVDKLIVANQAKDGDPVFSTKLEYSKIVAKFGKPDIETQKRAISNFGAVGVFPWAGYYIKYGGSPVFVAFNVTDRGCMTVRMSYYSKILEMAKQRNDDISSRRSGVADALSK